LFFERLQSVVLLVIPANSSGMREKSKLVWFHNLLCDPWGSLCPVSLLHLILAWWNPGHWSYCLFVWLFVHHIKGLLTTYLKIQKMERKLEDIIFL
jgi:hypothetical protein